MRKHLVSSLRSPEIRNILKECLSVINPEVVKFKAEMQSWLYWYYSLIIWSFMILASFKLFGMITSNEPDYEYIIFIGERVTILIATLAVLTFTYAAVLDYPKKEATIQIGKCFFRSLLHFAIGIIFSIGFRERITNQSNIFSLPDSVFNYTIIVNFFLFFIGFAMILFSAYYLAIGITRLMKSLR